LRYHGGHRTAERLDEKMAEWKDIAIGTARVHENTPSTAVVVARDPVPVYLYARRTVVYPTE